MSKYRILEKEGTIQHIPESFYIKRNTYIGIPFYNTHDIPQGEKIIIDAHDKYVPRFIVQEQYGQDIDPGPHACSSPYICLCGAGPEWVDLKEFTSIEAARKYKRSLELKDGIVIE